MRWIILLSVCACGDVVMPAMPDAPRAPTPDSTPSDGELPLGDWSMPVRIDTLSTAGFSDANATVRADGCELYFNSNRPDGSSSDIWMSTRPTINDPWGPPSYVSELDLGSSTESGADLSHDGLTLWFSRAIPGGSTGYDIFVATRDSITSRWHAPVAVTELNTSNYERSPHVSADGKTMWFAYYVSETSDYDIYVANRSSPTGTWSNIRELTRFTTAFEEDGPTTTADETVMYFDSLRGDGVTWNIYRSTRVLGDPWSVPQMIPALAGGLRADITPDERYMVLTMFGPDGTTDLYESRR